ncbi:MAG: hypothetical protein JKY18_05280 [Flavobacteriales bacterium]|nr:hypothetical protein [Flavobacteriales bacterium]
MNAEGTEIWKQLTAANIGKALAIVIDDKVYSFPTVNTEIPNGRSNISGAFTINEAKDFATLLNVSPLPCRLKVVDEAVIH